MGFYDDIKTEPGIKNPFSRLTIIWECRVEEYLQNTEEGLVVRENGSKCRKNQKEENSCLTLYF